MLLSLFSAYLHKGKSDAAQNTTVKELNEIYSSIPAIFPAAFRSTLELFIPKLYICQLIKIKTGKPLN